MFNEKKKEALFGGQAVKFTLNFFFYLTGTLNFTNLCIFLFDGMTSQGRW